MTLILETGSGVRGANAYATVAFVTQYLTDRGRGTEGAWDTTAVADQESAIIEATAYTDRRWGPRFKGFRLEPLIGRPAQGLLTFNVQPVAAETVTVGTQLYTFVAALTQFVPGQVLIGVDADTTAQNLINAINGADNDGTTYSEATVGNSEATAALLEGSTNEILLTARNLGESGNDIVLSSTAAGVVVTVPFSNGLDAGSQPLEFPRQALTDRAGREVIGIPLRLKQATAEYAVRQNVAPLDPDPTVDDTGLQVILSRRKTDVLERETEYAENAPLDSKSYPAADRLIQDYLKPVGVIRA